MPQVKSLTFMLLNEGAVAMSPSGNHTLAIINDTENYELLKTALADIITEVSKLHSLYIDEHNFKVEYFLCCDLTSVCGIESALSTYPCVWCKCPSSQRYNMEMHWSFSDKQMGARTIDDIISCHKRPKSQKFGCANPPLFPIAIDHVVPDILHLHLRITDVLFNLLIVDIQRYDAVTRISNPAKSKYLDEHQ